MKNFLIVAISLAFSASYAQTNIYNSNGSLTSPRTVSLNGTTLTFQSNSGPSVYMNGNTGNVGIGSSTPAEKLDVNGNVQAKMGHFTNSLDDGQTFTDFAQRNSRSLVLSAGKLISSLEKIRTFSYFDFPQSNLNSTATVWLGINDRAYQTRFRFWAAQAAGGKFVLFDKNQSENVDINDDGNNNISFTMPKANSFVGIGTTSFTDGTDIYKLSVNGNIMAHRVKVYTTWADYVFEDDYQLPTLEEVETHIREKGHLIDVPSATEVEANGIELGEMNKILLQKIEELTLYTIELNKQVKELQSQLNK